MATITATAMDGTGDRPLTFTALTGTADTFTYEASKSPVLVMTNNSGGPLVPTILGADATNVSVPGVGLVDVSGGFAVGSIADGDTATIPLGSISGYLTGVIDITGGTALDCALMNF